MALAANGWHRVLLVDNGSILLAALGAAIGARGYDVLAVVSDDEGQELSAAIDRYQPDVVLLDQRTLALSLRQLNRALRRKAPKFLALRQGDQPTDAAELRHSLHGRITVCTPADLQSLLP